MSQHRTSLKNGVLDRIGDYELIRRIGAGAYADVWLARDAVGKHVAVKVIDRERLHLISSKNREVEALTLLRTQLPEHPHLIRVHHVGSDGPYLYYVMDLADDATALSRGLQPARPSASLESSREVDRSRDREEAVSRRDEGTEGHRDEVIRAATVSKRAERPAPRPSPRATDEPPWIDPDAYRPYTLSEEIDRSAPLPPAEAVEIVRQVLSAVKCLHDRGLIHRDIKPSNIVRVNGTWKLADIGLLTQSATEVTAIGTPDFMPPTGPIDHTADLYALGKILYCLITGQPARLFPLIPKSLLTPTNRRAMSDLNDLIARASNPDAKSRLLCARSMNEALVQCVQRIESSRGAVRTTSMRWLFAGSIASAFAAIIYLAVIVGSTPVSREPARQRKGEQTVQRKIPASLGVPLIHAASVFGSLPTPTISVPLNTNADVDTGNDWNPRLATNGAGNVIAVWQSNDPLDGTKGNDEDILFAVSGDNGQTWSSPRLLNSNGTSDSARDFGPQIATDGLGTWIAVWVSRDTLDGTLGSDRDILFAVTRDNGNSWTEAAPLTADAATDLGNDELPHIATDRSGRWMVVWTANYALDGALNSDFDILASVSTDNGETWVPPAPVNKNATVDAGIDFDPQVATGSADEWLVMWHSNSNPDALGDDFDILFARSTDHGGTTWTDPIPVNSDADHDDTDDMNASFATDGSGHWVAVWQHGDDSATNLEILAARSIDHAQTWEAPQRVNPTARPQSTVERDPHVVSAGDGVWLVAWQSNHSLGGTIGTDYDILFGISDDYGATWQSPRMLNTTAASDFGDDLNPHVIVLGGSKWLAAWSSGDTLSNTLGLDQDILCGGAQPQPAGRLLISGPFIAGGESWNEIHQFDLVTQVRTTLRTFEHRPGPITIGPEGALYVLVDAEERLYKLNPLTGETVEILDIPLGPFSLFNGIAVKLDGNLLISRDAGGSGQVDEYAPDGTPLGVWLGTTPHLLSSIKVTPNGTVALLCCGSIGIGEPNELVEFDLDGSNPRVVIDSTMGVRMYSFVFASPDEVLVMDARPNPVPFVGEGRISRYDWTTTPATFIDDLVGPPSPVPLTVARNAQDGSVYGAGPHVGGQGCVYGWAADGTPLNGGQPFPTCYGHGPLYAGNELIVNDCGSLDDCNGNFVSDDCDIATGTSRDCQGNGIPDECEPDSNGDGIPDDCVLLVHIDIIPGSVNLAGHGIIPVAILTTEEFDATTVDPDTVELAGATVAIRGNGSRMLASHEDVDGDGDIDLLLHVETENLSLETGATEAILTGQTYDGQPIRGSDTINIVPE